MRKRGGRILADGGENRVRTIAITIAIWWGIFEILLPATVANLRCGERVFGGVAWLVQTEIAGVCGSLWHQP